MDFIKLFLENLVDEGASLMTLSPAEVISLGATTTGATGVDLLDSKNAQGETLGTTSLGLATSLIENGEEAYNKTLKQLEMTQAYVESLDEQQLGELIGKLETKENELSIEEDAYIRKLKK